MNEGLIRKIILSITILISAWYFCMYGKRPNIFYGDAIGYYMYLPAVFIYHNIYNIDDLPTDQHISDGTLYVMDQLKGMAKPTPKGYIIDQYTCGVAIMELPFFLMVHGYEKVMGKTANGYSEAYRKAMKCCTFFYVLLGLMLLYKILKEYFTPLQASIGTCCMLLGTNLFWFTFSQGGMAHSYLFFLYALLIWLTLKVYKRAGLSYFIGLGFTAGLITLIRPTDILCVLIPLLYNVYNKETVRQRIKFIMQYRMRILAATIVFVLPILPQLIYWRALTGSYIYYSYGDQSFDFRHPKIIEGLFYFSNGWLPYTPLMLFSIAGLFFYRQYKSWAWTIWLLCPIYIYIIYSWYCYNYINGLGSRPMIHLYPLLAIPFTGLVAIVARRGLVTKLITGIFVVFFIAVNISYSMQRSVGVMESEGSNIAYNMKVFFRLHLHYDDLVVNDLAEKQPDDGSISKMGTLGLIGYADSVNAHYIKLKPASAEYVYAMGAEEYADSAIHVKYDAQKYAGAKWLKCTGRFMYPHKPMGYYKHLFVMSIKHNDKYLLWKACQIENKIAALSGHTPLRLGDNAPDVWGNVYYYVKIPKDIHDGDDIVCMPWNIGKEQLYMAYIKVEAFR